MKRAFRFPSSVMYLWLVLVLLSVEVGCGDVWYSGTCKDSHVYYTIIPRIRRLLLVRTLGVERAELSLRELVARMDEGVGDLAFARQQLTFLAEGGDDGG